MPVLNAPLLQENQAESKPKPIEPIEAKKLIQETSSREKLNVDDFILEQEHMDSINCLDPDNKELNKRPRQISINTINVDDPIATQSNNPLFTELKLK